MIRFHKRLTTIAALFAVACVSFALTTQAEPLPFTIDKPARIALDLPNTTLGLSQRRFDVRSGGVDTVLAAEANGRTRLVINVDTLIPYSTKVEGNSILVTIGAALLMACGIGAACSPCEEKDEVFHRQVF